MVEPNIIEIDGLVGFAGVLIVIGALAISAHFIFSKKGCGL